MEDRKARLKALAAKAGRAKPETEDDAENDATGETNKRPVKFRNYTPSDHGLQGEDSTQIGDGQEREKETEEPANKRAKTDDKPKSKLEEALEKAKKEVEQTTNGKGSTLKEEQSLTAIAPKKINWDLKRNIKQKLDKLEKRTQKAIVQLLRERLAREADEAVSEEGGEAVRDELD